MQNTIVSDQFLYHDGKTPSSKMKILNRTLKNPAKMKQQYAVRVN